MANIKSQEIIMEQENKVRSIDVEGATVEDAIKKALAILNVTREDVIVKVVSEEQRGLFGMEGAKPAKIKATLKNKIV